MNQELPQPKDGDLVLGGFEGTKRTLRSDSNEEEKMDTKEMVGFYGYREGEDITELWFVHQEKIYYFGTIKILKKQETILVHMIMCMMEKLRPAIFCLSTQNHWNLCPAIISSILLNNFRRTTKNIVER